MFPDNSISSDVRPMLRPITTGSRQTDMKYLYAKNRNLKQKSEMCTQGADKKYLSARIMNILFL